MDDKKILAAACAKVNADPGQVMSYHIYEDHIALVVDRGGAGCPKYIIPLSELTVTLEAGEHTVDNKEIKTQLIGAKPKRKSGRSKK
jgi:hypothetical protein